MLEVYVIVEKQKNIAMKLLSVLCFIIGAYFIYVSLGGFMFLMMIGLLLFVLGVILNKRRVEYEYSYFDGDFHFAKIINKERRKELFSCEIENLITIAPKGDRSLHQHENNPKVKICDFTSGMNDEKVYALVAKTDKGYHMIWFQPDEKYLDAVCVKYRQKVIR